MAHGGDCRLFGNLARGLPSTDAVRVEAAMNEIRIPVEDRALATLAHLSGLAGYIVPGGGIIVPIVLWMTQSHRPIIAAIARSRPRAAACSPTIRAEKPTAEPTPTANREEALRDRVRRIRRGPRPVRHRERRHPAGPGASGADQLVRTLGTRSPPASERRRWHQSCCHWRQHCSRTRWRRKRKRRRWKDH